MGRQDSSKGNNFSHKPPKKNQAPIDTYRKRLGKKEFTGQSKRDTISSKDKAIAKRSALGVKDIVLMLAGGAAILGVVYILLYFSVSYYTDDDSS